MAEVFIEVLEMPSKPRNALVAEALEATELALEPRSPVAEVFIEVLEMPSKPREPQAPALGLALAPALALAL